MVKEKLKKALEDAVGYYNTGLSADAAVIKSASDHDLTLDQTDRVVESFNTAKTINFYEKNAENRTDRFDLANKKNVTLAIFGSKTPEKKAECQNTPDPLDTAFYASSPDTSYNKKAIFAEKRAALLDGLAKAAEENWRHCYSTNTIQGLGADTLSIIKSAEDDLQSAINTIDNYLWTATEKMASDITRGSYDTPKEKADLFKVACPHKLVIEEVSKYCPLLKNATGGSYKNTPIVDTTLIDPILKEADSFMEAVHQRALYTQKQAEFKAKKEKVTTALLSDPFSPTKSCIKKTASDLVHKPQEKAADIVSGFADSMLDVSRNPESLQSVNERLRDDARGALLADLLSSDPILQDSDPRQVASIYKSLIASSPRVSLNKEIVRSVLRSAVNSIALSPADSKILTDVDKGVQTAYAGIGSKNES